MKYGRVMKGRVLCSVSGVAVRNGVGKGKQGITATNSCHSDFSHATSVRGKYSPVTLYEDYSTPPDHWAYTLDM